MFTILGVREGDLVDIASNFHWVVAGTVMDAALRRLGAGVIPGGPGLSDLRLDVLRRTGATVLQAFTPYAEKLGERLAELRELSDDGGQRHSLRLLLIGGELREANAKARLEALWSGAAARELYGTTEAGLNAVDCEYANGMHLSPQCFLEVVEPDTGQPVAPGSPGEIVITELFRSAQPFIRYRSGDLTEGLILDCCDCGLQTPRLGRIIGRKSDVLRVRGQFLYEALMRSCLNSFPRVDRWRVVVDRPGVIDTLILNVAPADGTTLGADDLTAITGLLRSSCTLTFDVRAVEPSAIEDGSWFEDRREFTGAA
jgi:phenylacetate-CoA ligase